MKTTTNQINIDKANVEAMLSGSAAEAQNGFSQLYKRHRDAIFYSVLKNVESKEVAQDLTQEVFAKVFERIKQYNPDFAFSTWAYKIARNVLIDHKRKEKCEVLSIEALSSEHGGEDNNSEMQFQLADKGAFDNHQLLDRKERKELVQRALASLKSDDARNVMTLLFIEDKEYKEAAKILGMPEGTLKAISVRAKREMLAFLQNPNLGFEYGRIRTTKYVAKVEEELEEEFAE